MELWLCTTAEYLPHTVDSTKFLFPSHVLQWFQDSVHKKEKWENDSFVLNIFYVFGYHYRVWTFLWQNSHCIRIGWNCHPMMSAKCGGLFGCNRSLCGTISLSRIFWVAANHKQVWIPYDGFFVPCKPDSLVSLEQNID